MLRSGERLVGEWLALAHSTRYELAHDPFVAFDLMREMTRLHSEELRERMGDHFVLPHEVHRGDALAADEALARLGSGGHGAIDEPEGVVYRLESGRGVELIAKYVRQGKVDGAYLPENSGRPAIWNFQAPAGFSTEW